MTAGEMILQTRREKGLSQEQLAEALDVSRQTVSRWENGERVPASDNLARLSQVLGVPMESLLDGVLPEPPAPEPEKAPEPEAPPAPAITPQRKKRRWIYALAAVLLAAAIALGGLLFWKSLDRSIPEEELKSEEIEPDINLPLFPLD